MLTVPSHPLLDARVLAVTFAEPLGTRAPPSWLSDLLALPAVAPLASDDQVRAAVRDLLRHGGYKPTGRGKPSSEYLIRAAQEGQLGSINVAVDLGNAISLHSGLPISVVDVAKIIAPMSITIAPAGARYVFNSAGQEIDLEGLLCLHDANGPCANAVKDAQRTKTDAATTKVWIVIWGTKALAGRTDATFRWLRETCALLQAACEPVSW